MRYLDDWVIIRLLICQKGIPFCLGSERDRKWGLLRLTVELKLGYSTLQSILFIHLNEITHRVSVSTT